MDNLSRLLFIIDKKTLQKLLRLRVINFQFEVEVKTAYSLLLIASYNL